MKQKELIIFDFDGTLFDSQIGIKNAIKYALSFEDITSVDHDILESFIGPPLHKSFSDHFGFDKQKIEILIKNLRVYYSDKGYKETALYPGIKKLIFDLKFKNKRLAIATAKPTKYAKQILENFNLLNYFSSIHGSSSKGELFPKKRVIGSVLQELEIYDNTECVMIGDTIYDMKGAQEHQMQCIAVNYGYGKAKDLKNTRPSLFVETVEELHKVLI